MNDKKLSRRNFLKASLLGGVAASTFPAPFVLNAAESTFGEGGIPLSAKGRVALTHGEDHP